MVLEAAGAAFSVISFCVKLRQEYELVQRFKEDCGKLHRLVQGVEKVLRTAAADEADMNGKQWADALQNVRATLDEVFIIFKSCQRMGILAAMWNAGELNQSLDRINSRLMVALQLIPIQQHAASSQRLRGQISDLRKDVQASDYAAARAAKQQSDELQHKLQGIIQQQQRQQQEMQQQHSALQQQNRLLAQQLQRQQREFMLQLANLMQGGSPRASQQQPGSSRTPFMPLAMDISQLDAEVADLQSCMKSAQPQQQQYLKQTIQFVQQIQQHQKTHTLHLAFGALPVPQQQQQQQQGPPRSNSNISRSSAAAIPSSMASSRSSSGQFAPVTPRTPYNRCILMPGTVPVVASAMLPPARRAMSIGETSTIEGQPSAPVLPGSQIWDGQGVASRQAGVMWHGSDAGGSSSGSSMQGAPGWGSSGGGGGFSRSSSSSSSMQAPVVWGTGSNGVAGWLVDGGAAGSSNSSAHMQPPVVWDTGRAGSATSRGTGGSSSGSSSVCRVQFVAPHGCNPTGVAAGTARTVDYGMPSAPVAAAAFGGSSTADVASGLQPWLLSLSAAKPRPTDPEAWRALGLALRSQPSISFSRQGLTDAHLEAIARYAAPFWPNVQSVDLSYNSLTAAGVRALVHHSADHWRYLRHLDLSGNSIGPEGAAALAVGPRPGAHHWPQLQRLLLDSNTIGNAGAQALAQHDAAQWPGLLFLGLQQNGIQIRGAAALAEPATMQKWGQMQTLDLRHNSISGQCADILRLAAAKMWNRPGAIVMS